jgi:hypothetical protein
VENDKKEVRKMDFGYPYYYPSVSRKEKRHPEAMKEIITKQEHSRRHPTKDIQY